MKEHDQLPCLMKYLIITRELKCRKKADQARSKLQTRATGKQTFLLIHLKHGSNSRMRIMAKEVPITLAAKPCQSPSNKKSTRHRLQDEYLSGFPGILKSVNNNEKVKGKSVIAGHPP